MSQTGSSAPESFRVQLRRHGFDLGSRLGRGAFGTVYRGVQKQFKRQVAIKFYNVGGIAIMADDRDRFRKEAQLLARVDHPSVPFVLTAGEVKTGATTVPYFVMQLVAGRPLDEVARQNGGKLALDRACRVVTEILDALSAVHDRRIIHRDIKPNNILISPSRAWLVDFSLGASLQYEPGLTRATRKRSGFGVPDYAAPEQLADAASCDHRADIYSLGVVLFETITGHTKMNLDRLAAQLSGHPPYLVDIVRRACAHDRDQRFVDAKSFKQSLEPLLSWPAPAESELMALCVNTMCDAATWSEGRGFFFAPRIGTFPQPFCDSCGQAFVRRCQRCHAVLSDEARERVLKETKSDKDGSNLFCAHCGHLIFEYPKCKKCDSLLLKNEMGRMTETEGCPRCTRRLPAPPTPTPTPSFLDDDVPF